MTTTFTPLELKALRALFADSAGNGHDFGVIESVKWSGSRKALGGLVTSLQQKGALRVYEPVITIGDRGRRYTNTQFVFSDVAAIERAIREGASS